jgi:hypothetical protein
MDKAARAGPAVATRRVLVRQGLPNFPKQTTAKAVVEVAEF